MEREPPTIPDAGTVVERLSSLDLGDDLFARLAAEPSLHTPSARPELEDATVVDAPFPDVAHHLRLEERIGVGGTSEVFAAWQHGLEREVAVKTLRPDQRDHAMQRRLVREARVLGGLQHPAILPVHLLGATEDGAPLIVMPRVHGRPWQSFVPPDGTLEAPPGEHDPLEWHLRVLMQVCSAVQFAHSRGVIHRDLKLSNVMVGDHGEVYVLDWGMAVAWRRDSEVDAPLLEHEAELLGTAGYMPPELAGVLPDQQGPTTDVYLLGACLHAVLTGQPRHGHGSALEKLARAWDSVPAQYAAEVPAELGAIANRCCMREPGDRFPSADALRRALIGSLEHRESAHLAERAAASLAALRAASGGPDDVVARHLGACRFAYGAALELWPDNDDAHAGLRSALLAAAEHAVARKRPQMAEALLAEVVSPPAELVEAVAGMARRRKARDRELTQLRAQQARQDLRVGRRRRGQLLVSLAALWTAAPLTVRLLADLGVAAVGYGSWLGVMLPAVAVTVGVVLLTRRSAMPNEGSRRLGFGLVSLGPALVAVVLIAAAAGLPLPMAQAFGLVTVAAGLTTLAASVDATLWPAALAWLAAGVASATWPSWFLEVAALGALAGFGGLARSWTRS